jgi:hypothetical protein
MGINQIIWRALGRSADQANGTFLLTAQRINFGDKKNKITQLEIS